MLHLILKVFVTSLVVVSVTEIAKRSTLMAAVLASLPLTSILAMIWLYQDTADAQATARLSTGIFWMVLPSLFFFIAFPMLLKSGFRFYPALTAACLLMAGVYWMYTQMLKRLGVEI